MSPESIQVLETLREDMEYYMKHGYGRQRSIPLQAIAEVYRNEIDKTYAYYISFGFQSWEEHTKVIKALYKKYDQFMSEKIVIQISVPKNP